MRRAARMAAVLAAGILGGMMLHVAWQTLGGRAGAPGGEALILPMIGALLYVGWQMGHAMGEEQGYRTGYRRAIHDAMARLQQHHKPGP